MKVFLDRYIPISLLLVNMLILAYARVIGVSYDLTSLIGTDSVRYVHQMQ